MGALPAEQLLLVETSPQTKKPQDVGYTCYGGRPKAVPANVSSYCDLFSGTDQLY